MKLRRYVPNFVVDVYHFFIAFVSAFIYSFPSGKIKVIAVTGTGGKSTVISVLSAMLKEAGYKVASSSSIVFKYGDTEEENKLKMTMPNGFILQKFLKRAVNEKCDYAIIEVTSEGIKQHRHMFINFILAAITNLNPEHIESHKGFDNYKKAKGELFKAVKGIHVINIDDDNAGYFLKFSAERIISYGIDNEKSEIRGEKVSVSPDGSVFYVGGVRFTTKLLCEFNVYNALCAIAIASSQGISLELCSKALSGIEQIAGRMEEVINSPFRVFVDYAFVPVSLEKVYKFLKPENGRLICVLGSCGGGRDKWKRPVLGSLAEKYGDVVIITNEDPYDDDPMEIIKDVAAGSPKAQIILDRREAIRKALDSAVPGDVVIITGKGCEPWICLANGKKQAWDDRKIAKEEFEKTQYFNKI